MTSLVSLIARMEKLQPDIEPAGNRFPSLRVLASITHSNGCKIARDHKGSSILRLGSFESYWRKPYAILFVISVHLILSLTCLVFTTVQKCNIFKGTTAIIETIKIVLIFLFKKWPRNSFRAIIEGCSVQENWNGTIWKYVCFDQFFETFWIKKTCEKQFYNDVEGK